MGPSFVVYGEATRIRHHMRESSIALHQHSSQAGQVGPSSGGGGGGDGTADTEDDDDSILTESEQDAEDECEAQEVMQRMITDELAGKSSSMLAASPQWKILKENLEKHADNLEMCTGAKTSSAAPVCRQISTSDKNDDKTGGGRASSCCGRHEVRRSAIRAFDRAVSSAEQLSREFSFFAHLSPDLVRTPRPFQGRRQFSRCGSSRIKHGSCGSSRNHRGDCWGVQEGNG